MGYQRFSKLSMQRREFDFLKLLGQIPCLFNAALRRHDLFEVVVEPVQFLQFFSEFYFSFVAARVRDHVLQYAARVHNIPHLLRALQSAFVVQHAKLSKQDTEHSLKRFSGRSMVCVAHLLSSQPRSWVGKCKEQVLQVDFIC